MSQWVGGQGAGTCRVPDTIYKCESRVKDLLGGKTRSLYKSECVCELSRFSRFWLCVTLWTVTHQALLSMGILQARILEWVAIPSSRGSSWPRGQTRAFPASQADSLPTEPPGKPTKVNAAAAKSLQSCPTLCDPTDGRPPGSPVPAVLQARALEWVAISFSTKVNKAPQIQIAGKMQPGNLNQRNIVLNTRKILGRAKRHLFQSLLLHNKLP